MQFGIIGSGSWATALAKILTDNGNTIHWWMRNADNITYMQKRRHNAPYLSGAYFNQQQLNLNNNLSEVVQNSDVLVIAVPSAYIEDALSQLNKDALKGKKIISAIKGILPTDNLLLNDYLIKNFDVAFTDYFTVLGPCHAEEVAAEKLSYLTFSGIDENTAKSLSVYFSTEYINTIVNNDLYKTSKPVFKLGTFTNIVFVSKASPIKDMKDLIELSQKKQINFAHGGVGTASHKAMVRLCEKTLNCLPVPYKGASQAMLDLLNGTVDTFAVVSYGADSFLQNTSYKSIGKITNEDNWVILFGKNLSDKNVATIQNILNGVSLNFFIEMGFN